MIQCDGRTIELKLEASSQVFQTIDAIIGRYYCNDPSFVDLLTCSNHYYLCADTGNCEYKLGKANVG